jgi:ATP-dependent DNA helicase RecQ
MTKEQVLKKHFGYDTFRKGQTEVIDHVLGGGHSLVLMPTGGGKSVCYQVPALMLPGLTLVISPLIALMQDQVSALKANGIAAAFINSTLSYGEQEDITRQCRMGELKLLYLSPERLMSGTMLEFLKSCNLSLVAIDESHCISQWGHDFRPEYRKLGAIREWFPNTAVLALTATADRATRRDIVKQLGIEDGLIHVSGFDRPNLSLEVRAGRERLDQIDQAIQLHPKQSGIVYCLSRKSTESVAEGLKKRGHKVAYYHAGMDNADRLKAQQQFLKDEVQVMVATVAFGMGIDKSNVRFVIHYNLPPNVEGFYQEIGRGGRDGLPATTILFYSFQDVMARMDMIDKGEYTDEHKEMLHAKLDRMKQYAESEICRRRVLLTYFNEDLGKDCGNCDVCRNPPKHIDGTILAQKALSGIARMQERVGVGMLVDVLRASHNQNILSRGFDKLPTFGVGRDLSTNEWHHYVHQMLNSGIIDIAYDEGASLKLNKKSWQILKESKKVSLTQFVSFKKQAEVEKVKSFHNKPVKPKPEDLIFDQLVIWRKRAADRLNITPHNVLSDATLQAIGERKPLYLRDFDEVAGMSQERIGRFGIELLAEVRQCANENKFRILGMTYADTLQRYIAGENIETMATEKNIATDTIANHLIKLNAEGHPIDFTQFLRHNDQVKIMEVVMELNLIDVEPPSIVPLLEYFGDTYQGWELRMGLLLAKQREA